jgi:small acid-soluble spore protein F (minor alpha/beta-type SASP)
MVQIYTFLYFKKSDSSNFIKQRIGLRGLKHTIYAIGRYLVNVIMDSEGIRMSRRKRSVMSEQLKNELAKDLGFYDTVQQEGWGGIRAKDAGNMVKRAIQLAEQAAAKSNQP